MAIGSAIASVQRRSASATVVDVMARKVLHTSVKPELSDTQVSNGLGNLERALEASGSISDDADGAGEADDVNDGDVIVAAHLATWVSGSTGSGEPTNRVANRLLPGGSFDEQLDGLNEGLAKPVRALPWQAADDDNHEMLEEAGSTWPTLLEDDLPEEDESTAWHLEESPALPLENVESLREAFERIDRQIGSMDLLCQELMAQ